MNTFLDKYTGPIVFLVFVIMIGTFMLLNNCGNSPITDGDTSSPKLNLPERTDVLFMKSINGWLLNTEYSYSCTPPLIDSVTKLTCINLSKEKKNLYHIGFGMEIDLDEVIASPGMLEYCNEKFSVEQKIRDPLIYGCMDGIFYEAMGGGYRLDVNGSSWKLLNPHVKLAATKNGKETLLIKGRI